MIWVYIYSGDDAGETADVSPENGNSPSPARRYRLRHDIFLCFGITFACSMFGFESYVDENVMGPVRIAAAVLMTANWWRTAYTSGRNGRSGFMLFAGLYWLVPSAAAMLLTMGDTNSAAVSVIIEAASVMVFYPFRCVSDMTGISEWVFCAAMLCTVMLSYFFGLKRSREDDIGS